MSPPAILLTDSEGRVTAANARWGEVTGAPSPVNSRNVWLDCLHPDDRGWAAAEWSQCLRTRREAYLPVRVQPTGASARPVHILISPLPDDRGGFLVTLAETSSSEATDAEALHARKMEAVGRLSSGLAHDFANLLTLISGYSEIILTHMAPEEALREEVDEIRKAARRGCRLTQQLLTFSRRQNVEPQLLDLNVLLRDMQKMLPRMIGEHIDVVTQLGADLGAVRADAGQVEQVVMNLAINARDAMPRGGKIVIRTTNLYLDAQHDRVQRGLRPGAYVLLQFQDSGHGMDRETLSHLFEPFFTTKDKGKGTGLGLSIVYSMVKQSDGDVWVESEPGKGTIVNVCLPRRDGAIEQPQPQPERGAADARAAVRGAETILLVEDEDGVRRLLTHILSKNGYTVVEAANGPEALNVFRSLGRPLDLLLTDIVMPRMSGRELAARLLKLQPDLRVIFMSGYTDEAVVGTGGYRSGARFMQKPLHPEMLAETVRELLDGRPSAQQAPHAHAVSSHT